MARMQPRFIDTWVIPPLMIWLALRQSPDRKGGGMGRWPRRMLFTAGAYMLMRNYGNYKTALTALASISQSKGA
jgi:hypothetical protein